MASRLRISINAPPRPGPYGGGKQFAEVLCRYLAAKGHEVRFDLPWGLDIVMVVAAHPHARCAYGIEEVRAYKRACPQTGIVHRVNGSDQATGCDHGRDVYHCRAIQVADHVIYISEYIKSLFRDQYSVQEKATSTILNGADDEMFRPRTDGDWNSNERMRIVTHHWSPNFMKGFDVYERLDDLLGGPPYRDLFEFTYIGQLPFGWRFRHARVMTPLSGRALADELKRHHVYVTGARKEAGGMHHIEGMRCGLPVLYLNSGALPEYCASYGVEFDLSNFESRLEQMREDYPAIRKAVTACPYSGDAMAQRYEQVFLDLKAKESAKETCELGVPRIARLLLPMRLGLARSRVFVKKVRKRVFHGVSGQL
jgi:hypothetical protein